MAAIVKLVMNGDATVEQKYIVVSAGTYTRLTVTPTEISLLNQPDNNDDSTNAQRYIENGEDHPLKVSLHLFIYLNLKSYRS